MSSSLYAMTILMALGGGPYGCPTCQSGGYDSGSYAGTPMGGYSAGSSYGSASYVGGGYGGGIYSTGMGLNPYSGSNGDTLLPWDSQEAWMHGYFQEISPYSGYHFYRPYNYKHVFSQADLAYRWGQPHGMPYSQQWWHKYQDRAAMNPGVQAQVSQASAYHLEMARLRAWRDFQAEQQRISPASAQQPVLNGVPTTQIAPRHGEPIVVPADGSIQTVIDQQQGLRTNVVPAIPSTSLPRSMQMPVIPEFPPSTLSNRR